MLASLNLSRPLVFFDIESTGLNLSRDRIVELGGIKIKPDQSREEFLQRFNPCMPIPPEVTRIHGITDAMVAHEPKFADKLPEIMTFFSNCDIAGYNITRFDVPLFAEELLRCGITELPFADARYIDCLTLWRKKEPKRLSDALRYYADEDLVDAHTTRADVEATIKVLAGQLKKHTDLQPDLGHLHNLCMDGNSTVDYAGCFSRNAEGEIIFNIGKDTKGKRACDNPGMLKWMLDKDFTSYTKYIARKILDGSLK